MKKTSKKPMTQWEKNYRRYCRNYNLILLACVVLIALVWWFVNTFWGLATSAFVLWSVCWYDSGATENCIDEYEYAYAEDGLSLMFKSWPWFFVLVIPAYFFFKAVMPGLFD